MLMKEKLLVIISLSHFKDSFFFFVFGRKDLVKVSF